MTPVELREVRLENSDRITALVATTTGEPAKAASPRRRCLGIYASAALGVHRPFGSWYEGDIDPGPGVGLALGHRAHWLVAFEASWYGGISNSSRNIDSVTFEIATLNARFFTTPDRDTEWFLDAGVSPSARMRIGGLSNRGYATHAGVGMQWGRGAIRGTAAARYYFVRYTEGSLDGFSGTLGRQRHGDLLLVSVALTVWP